MVPHCPSQAGRVSSCWVGEEGAVLSLLAGIESTHPLEKRHRLIFALAGNIILLRHSFGDKPIHKNMKKSMAEPADITIEDLVFSPRGKARRVSHLQLDGQIENFLSGTQHSLLNARLKCGNFNSERKDGFSIVRSFIGSNG